MGKLKSVYVELEDDLHIAFETDNLDEAKLVIKRAEEAFEDKLITAEQLGALVYDFHVFADSIPDDV